MKGLNLKFRNNYELRDWLNVELAQFSIIFPVIIPFLSKENIRHVSLQKNVIYS